MCFSELKVTSAMSSRSSHLTSKQTNLSDVSDSHESLRSLQQQAERHRSHVSVHKNRGRSYVDWQPDGPIGSCVNLPYTAGRDEGFLLFRCPERLRHLVCNRPDIMKFRLLLFVLTLDRSLWQQTIWEVRQMFVLCVFLLFIIFCSAVETRSADTFLWSRCRMLSQSFSIQTLKFITVCFKQRDRSSWRRPSISHVDVNRVW